MDAVAVVANTYLDEGRGVSRARDIAVDLGDSHCVVGREQSGRIGFVWRRGLVKG